AQQQIREMHESILPQRRRRHLRRRRWWPDIKTRPDRPLTVWLCAQPQESFANPRALLIVNRQHAMLASVLGREGGLAMRVHCDPARHRDGEVAIGGPHGIESG